MFRMNKVAHAVAVTQPMSPSALMESRVGEYFLNEYTDMKTFKGLDEQALAETVSSYALSEFVNTTNIVDALFKGKGDVSDQFGKMDSVLSKNEYFKNIALSNGDITRTKHYQNLVNLLNYGISTNASSTFKSDGTMKFEDAAHAILDAMESFKRSAPRLRAMIHEESTQLNGKRLTESFYNTSVYLLQISGDLLYSNSLRAEFDYTAKVPFAKNTYFSYDTGVLDEILVFVNHLTTALRSGKVFQALSPKLQESFTQAVENISSLNEGVFDTVFGLVSHFKGTDLIILWPIYMIRTVTYWIGYIWATMKSITIDVEESLRLRKSTTMTKAAYDAYNAKASKKGQVFKQAFAKADMAISLDASSDKKTLENLNVSNGGMLI